jgi:EAL domain-containing protein (putative c-di-GMP-specific phosphodiesterase class I)
VQRALDVTGADPAHLLLELTETALASGAEAATEILQNLKALGVTMSIDDFGTGYSSLSHLKRFPVDQLKIDRAFVDGLGRDKDDTAIVTAIVALAKAMGLEVVAEGVETAEQLAELDQLGCDLAQGWYFHRARPAADWAELLALPTVPAPRASDESVVTTGR